MEKRHALILRYLNEFEEAGSMELSGNHFLLEENLTTMANNILLNSFVKKFLKMPF